jgi:hypothetical protein
VAPAAGIEGAMGGPGGRNPEIRAADWKCAAGWAICFRLL